MQTDCMCHRFYLLLIEYCKLGQMGDWGVAFSSSLSHDQFVCCYPGHVPIYSWWVSVGTQEVLTRGACLP